MKTRTQRCWFVVIVKVPTLSDRCFEPLLNTMASFLNSLLCVMSFRMQLFLPGLHTFTDATAVSAQARVGLIVRICIFLDINLYLTAFQTTHETQSVRQRR